MSSKSVVLRFLKWIFIIIIGGAGWIALLVFVIAQGFSEGGNRLGLPISDIDSDEFWNYGYEGDIPESLREKSKLIVYSRVGFTDVSFTGLVKLGDKEKSDLLNNTLKTAEIVKDYNLFNEKILCLGSHQLALSWSIQNGLVMDYFEFCKNLDRKETMKWRSVRLTKKEVDGGGYSYLDINHLVGTNYFTIDHGKS